MTLASRLPQPTAKQVERARAKPRPHAHFLGSKLTHSGRCERVARAPRIIDGEKRWPSPNRIPISRRNTMAKPWRGWESPEKKATDSALNPRRNTRPALARTLRSLTMGSPETKPSVSPTLARSGCVGMDQLYPRGYKAKHACALMRGHRLTLEA